MAIARSRAVLRKVGLGGERVAAGSQVGSGCGWRSGN